MIMGTALSPEIRLGVGKITANVLGTIQDDFNVLFPYSSTVLLEVPL